MEGACDACEQCGRHHQQRCRPHARRTASRAWRAHLCSLNTGQGSILASREAFPCSGVRCCCHPRTRPAYGCFLNAWPQGATHTFLPHSTQRPEVRLIQKVEPPCCALLLRWPRAWCARTQLAPPRPRPPPGRRRSLACPPWTRWVPAALPKRRGGDWQAADSAAHLNANPELRAFAVPVRGPRMRADFLPVRTAVCPVQLLPDGQDRRRRHYPLHGEQAGPVAVGQTPPPVQAQG